MTITTSTILAIIFGTLLVISAVTNIVLFSTSSPAASKAKACGDCAIGCLDKSGNSRWINALSKASGGKTISPDPHINGYKKFCKNPSNSTWMEALSNANEGKEASPDPNINGYNDFRTVCQPPPPCVCVKCKTGTSNCPNCTVSHAEWIKRNGFPPNSDPDLDGYIDFCFKSSGTPDDWYNNVYTKLPTQKQSPANQKDPAINGYNNFCNTVISS
jgi:hypothetical protein